MSKQWAIWSAIALAAAASGSSAMAQEKIKVGFMLPYSGTYAALGNAIENGFRMYVGEQGGKLGGREIEYFKVDDESDPAKATDNVNRLIKRDKVDVIVGTVHSGVQMAIQKVVAESGTLSIIPNAGVHAVTRNACLPNVFRTSFTMGQPTVALGQAMIERKARRAVWVTWNYPAGADSLEGFREGYVKAGGSIVKELKVPFPSTDFSAVLADRRMAELLHIEQGAPILRLTSLSYGENGEFLNYSIMFRNAMKGSSIPCYTGLPNTLKQAGYSTMFFMTHESQYDNMNAFFSGNGYRIVDQSSVPDGEMRFTFINPRLARMLGRTEKDLLGRRFDSLYPSHDLGSGQLEWLPSDDTDVLSFRNGAVTVIANTGAGSRSTPKRARTSARTASLAARTSPPRAPP